jgi:hypothetical protein
LPSPTIPRQTSLQRTTTRRIDIQPLVLQLSQSTMRFGSPQEYVDPKLTPQCSSEAPFIPEHAAKHTFSEALGSQLLGVANEDNEFANITAYRHGEV